MAPLAEPEAYPGETAQSAVAVSVLTPCTPWQPPHTAVRGSPSVALPAGGAGRATDVWEAK